VRFYCLIAASSAFVTTRAAFKAAVVVLCAVGVTQNWNESGDADYGQCSKQ